MKLKLQKLMFTLFAVMVCASVNAQTGGSCGDNATWSYAGTTLTISGTGAMYDYAYGETPWGDYAEEMKTVQINEGVTSVGNNAFAGFTALKSVTFPSSGFTHIGDYAFSGCTSYKNLNMPQSMTEIGEGAFSGSAVRGATIYGGVQKIGDYAFEACTNLEGVAIYEGVEEIGESAFDGCGLISVVIPSTVTTIGGGAFMSNDALETVYIGAGVANIGAAAFQGCTSLTSVGLGGATAPTLDDAVFTDYDGETPLAIDAFYVPSTTPYSSGWGGYAADKFKTVYESTWANSDDPAEGNGTWSFNVTTGTLTVNGTGNLNVSPWMGMSAINPELYDNEHPGYWSKVLSFVVGEGITHIQTMGVGMQINCASVTLPSTLKYVGYSCLEECAFTSIELPEGLETIDDYTFFDSKLTSLTIPSTVTYIGSSAFLANEDLATITCLPTTPPNLGPYEPCFGDGSTITAIYVPAGSVDAYKNWEWDESVGYTAWEGWKAYADKIQPIGSSSTKTIYCKMEHGWWTADGAAVGIFTWDDEGHQKAAWPGERMTLVDGETNVWKFDLDVSKYHMCVFTRVNGSGNIEYWNAKTNDLTIPTDDKDLFTITTYTAAWDDKGNKCDGEWSIYSKFRIVGSMTDWSPTIYSKTDSYTFENLAVGKYQFKVVDGDSWKGLSDMTEVAGGLYVDQDGNVCFVLDEAGNVTVNYKSGELYTATGNFVAPEIKLIGINGWTEATDAIALTTAADKKSASVTLPLAGDWYDFKVIRANEWLGKVNADGNYTIHSGWNWVDGLVRNYEGLKAISLKPDMTGTLYTFTYVFATGKLTVTFPLSLSEETDNTDALDWWNEKEANVTIYRTLKAGAWNSIALPFDINSTTLAGLKLAKGVNVKELISSSFANGTLTLNFDDATSIEAGKPYLVKVSGADDIDLSTLPQKVTVSKTTVPVWSTDGNVGFIPTLGKTAIPAGDEKNVLFMASGSTLKHPTSLPTDMKGFRAYFQLKGEAANASSFNIDFGDETTGISNLNVNDNENLGNATPMYNTAGQRVNKSYKGIVIVNGKKVVIK